VTTTRLTSRIAAPRSAVYRALLDPEAVQRWMVPDGMTSAVHEFDAREGGELRISLTYDEPTTAGKTTARTDSFTAASSDSSPMPRSCRSSSSTRTTRPCRVR
jgi:uncharacterized protein YndB with AHSA1/START domain